MVEQAQNVTDEYRFNPFRPADMLGLDYSITQNRKTMQPHIEQYKVRLSLQDQLSGPLNIRCRPHHLVSLLQILLEAVEHHRVVFDHEHSSSGPITHWSVDTG